RALELAPANSVVLHHAGLLALNLGRLEEAIGFCGRALEQDPLSATIYHNLGYALDAAGRFEKAQMSYHKTLELAPQRASTHASFSWTLLAQGQGEEALAETMREPEELYRLWALASVNHALGHGAESESALRELIEKHSTGGAYQIADAHAI